MDDEQKDLRKNRKVSININKPNRKAKKKTPKVETRLGEMPARKKPAEVKKEQTDLKERRRVSRKIQMKPMGEPQSVLSQSDASDKSAKPEFLADYTIVAGDSLSKIAKDYYGSYEHWPKIHEANKAVIGDNPNLIQVGQVLKIPKIE